MGLEHMSLQDEEAPRMVTKGMEWEGAAPREVSGFSLPAQSMRKTMRPVAGKRRRSSPLNMKKARVVSMTPILE